MTPFRYVSRETLVYGFLIVDEVYIEINMQINEKDFSRKLPTWILYIFSVLAAAGVAFFLDLPWWCAGLISGAVMSFCLRINKRG